MRLTGIARWLYARAENILALLLAIMFFGFVAQIVFRYFLNFPIGWTSELTIIMWLWLVLWGAAFVVREDEEIRFDLVFDSVGPAIRRLMAVVGGLAVIGLYTFSLPATVDYVTFMKVQETAYLDIRYDHLFSIYVVFAVAVICRYAWLVWKAFRRAPKRLDPTQKSSTL